MSSIECFVPSMSGEDISVTVESFSRSDSFSGVTILSGVSLKSTETENTLWQVFSVYKIPTTNDYIQTDFSSDEQYLNFLNYYFLLFFAKIREILTKAINT